jgi:hypothetical protein
MGTQYWYLVILLGISLEIAIIFISLYLCHHAEKHAQI